MIEMANEKSNFHFPLDAVRIDMIFAVEWLCIADDESFVAASRCNENSCMQMLCDYDSRLRSKDVSVNTETTLR